MERDPTFDAADLAALVAQVFDQAATPAVPIDAGGTDFQQRVWQALRRIPRGATRSYGEIAATIGQPGAARAVGRAVASNHLAVLVPCHRVLPAAGGTGGYRWGPGRKAALLAWEARPIFVSSDGSPGTTSISIETTGF